MTTRAGASVRCAIRESFNILHVWDLGDTKLFGAAVLPAVLLLEGKNGRGVKTPGFSSIYEAAGICEKRAKDPIDALVVEGVVQIDDGRLFRVRHGNLDTSGAFDGVWRLATKEVDSWLSVVDRHTWGTFRDIGKIRVGVKTCADQVFIRSDWHEMPESERPELPKMVATHHVARRFRALSLQPPKQILYTHHIIQGQTSDQESEATSS
jgi:hypothetical protein